MGSEHTIPALYQAINLIDDAVPVIVEYKMDLVDITVCEKGHPDIAGIQGRLLYKSFDPRVLM